MTEWVTYGSVGGRGGQPPLLPETGGRHHDSYSRCARSSRLARVALTVWAKITYRAAVADWSGVETGRLAESFHEPVMFINI